MSIYEFATDSNFSDKFFFSVKRVIGNEVIYWINANTFAHGYKNISDRTPKTGFEKSCTDCWINCPRTITRYCSYST